MNLYRNININFFTHSFNLIAIFSRYFSFTTNPPTSSSRLGRMDGSNTKVEPLAAQKQF